MIRITEVPEGEKKSGLYTVKVNGMPVDVFSVRVSAYPYNYGWPGYQRPIEQSEEAALVSLESDEETVFTVTLDRDFSEVIVRPVSRGIVPEVSGRTVTFTVPGPGQYSLEADGHHGNLHIFVDAPKEYPTEDVLYFGPGVHKIGPVQLRSGQTVVVDRGAVVIGGFYAIDADNVRILGKGIIDGRYETRTSDTLLLAVDVETWGPLPHDEAGLLAFAEKTDLLVGCVKLYNCRGCEIEGVTCVDSATWVISCYACSDLHIDGIKEVGQWKYNTDGIDLMNCHDVLVENSFLRNFDDCMVIKGIKGWDMDNVYNIRMRNLVVWCDWGRALEIGAETCADEYGNILFEDCDVIHAAYSMLDIQNGDRAYVHDVTFRNIRCEYTKYQQQDYLQTDMSVPYAFPPLENPPRIILIQGYTGQWSKDGIPGRTERVRYENITYYTDDDSLGVPVIDIKGYSEGHGVENVVIDGICHGQTRLKPEQLVFRIGKHVGPIDVK